MKLDKKLWISILISLLFIIMILYQVDFEKTKEALKNANYFFIPLGIALSLITNIVRSHRWKYVISPVKKISLQSLFSGVAIGYMANNLLPARLGEFIRAYMMGKKEGISKSSTLATIVVERIFDGFSLLFFLIVLSFISDLPAWTRQAGLLAAVFFVLLSLFLLFVVVKRETGIIFIQKFIGMFSSRLASRSGKLFDGFITGLGVVKHKKNLFLIFSYSLLVWLIEASTYYVVSFSFNINLPVYVFIITVVIVNLGILIPSAPGYIGSFEFFTISSLAIFSIENSLAFSYAIVLHAVLFLPITMVGLFFFWKENVNLAEAAGIAKMPSPRA